MMKNPIRKIATIVISVFSTISTNLHASEESIEIEQNFRFALPEDYLVMEHKPIPEYSGGSALLFTEETSVAENADAQHKLVRVQTYLSKFYPVELVELQSNEPKEFLKKIIESQLNAQCSSFSFNSGKVRKRRDETRINWWTRCTLADSNGWYEYERGRIFLSDSGAYILSQVNRNDNPDHRFGMHEKKWFDTYLYGSRFCTSGNNCGQEGALVSQLYREKAE